MLPLFYSELEIIIEAEFEMVRHQMFMTCMKLLNAYMSKKIHLHAVNTIYTVYLAIYA